MTVAEHTRPNAIRFLPAAVVVLVVLAGLLLTLIAPSRVLGGVYQVRAGVGDDTFRVSSDQLACDRDGNRSRCVATLVHAPLVVDISYRNVADSTCSATYGGRPLPCRSWRVYGPASHLVEIPDQMGILGEDLADVRAEFPWWRWVPDGVWLLVGFGVALLAGAVSASIAGRTAHRLRPARRDPWTSGPVVGLVALAAPIGVAYLMAADRLLFLLPVIALLLLPTAGGVAAWRAMLDRPGSGLRYGAAAAAVTLTYTALSVLLFSVAGGFVG